MAQQALAQMIDRTQSPNNLNEGIVKSLEEAGPGEGDWYTLADEITTGLRAIRADVVNRAATQGRMEWAKGM